MHRGGAPKVPVAKIDPETLETIKVYPSIAKAAEENYVSKSCIKAAINGKQKKCISYIWVRI